MERASTQPQMNAERKKLASRCGQNRRRNLTADAGKGKGNSRLAAKYLQPKEKASNQKGR